jgi:hypothetical protein
VLGSCRRLRSPGVLGDADVLVGGRQLYEEIVGQAVRSEMDSGGVVEGDGDLAFVDAEVGGEGRELLAFGAMISHTSSSHCLGARGVYRFQSYLLTSARRKIGTLGGCAVGLSPDSSGKHAVDHDVDGVAEPLVDISCYKLGGVARDQRKPVGW